MAITTCYHNLCSLGMVLWSSYFNPLNNRNPFVQPMDTGPSPIDSIGTAAQITGVVLIYKDNKYKLTFTRIQMHRNQSMIKAYLTTSLHIQDIIVSPWKAFRKCFRICFKKKIKNQMAKKKAPSIAQSQGTNSLPITFWRSHGNTFNLFHNSKSCKNQK